MSYGSSQRNCKIHTQTWIQRNLFWVDIQFCNAVHPLFPSLGLKDNSVACISVRSACECFYRTFFHQMFTWINPLQASCVCVCVCPSHYPLYCCFCPPATFFPSLVLTDPLHLCVCMCVCLPRSLPTHPCWASSSVSLYSSVFLL